MRASGTQELQFAPIILVAAGTSESTFDVSAFVALLLLGTGSDVVVPNDGPHEQRQQGIDQRGLTGAVLADQKR